MATIEVTDTSRHAAKKSKTENGVNGHTVNGSQNSDITTMETQTKFPFLQNIFNLMIKEIEKDTDVSKVVDFVHPGDLMKRLDLSLHDQGDDNERLLELCQDTIKYSVNTGHPGFHNQLFGGFDQYGLSGAWLTETLNASQYTYEVAPVFTLMEQVVLKKMRDIIGYTTGDGIFCPGGSISNMYAISLARYQKYPEVKTEGMQGLPKICMFTSEQSHYSMKKGCCFMGIGVNNIISVACDERGKMIPKALEEAIEKAKSEGRTPFLVNGTCGTTVVGAFDPIVQLADICEKYKLWFHVDACWGGGTLMSKKHKYKLKGIERSDSVAWNAHKMMGAPQQCCAFLTKHENLLQQCHSANAKYLFQQDKFYDVSFDTGDKSIQCGRKVDVFKLWLMWKAKGNKGFEKEIDNAYENARYLTEKIKNTEGFQMVFPEPECTNVCFWYIPSRLRGKEKTPEWWEELGKVPPKIKEGMAIEGTMMIGYQPLGDRVNFFRMVIPNTKLSHQNMDRVVSEIDRLGNNL